MVKSGTVEMQVVPPRNGTYLQNAETAHRMKMVENVSPRTMVHQNETGPSGTPPGNRRIPEQK